MDKVLVTVLGRGVSLSKWQILGIQGRVTILPFCELSGGIRDEGGLEKYAAS